MLKILNLLARKHAVLLLLLTLQLTPWAQGAEPEAPACAASSPASKPGTTCRNSERQSIRIAPPQSTQGVGTLNNYVYCSATPSSGPDGKKGNAPAKESEGCKDQSTKVEVDIKGVKLKVDTQNVWIASSALIVALGFAVLIFRGVNSKKAEDGTEDSTNHRGVFAALGLLVVVLFGTLAGYWLRGEVETRLTQQQISDLQRYSDFSREFDLARDSTRRAEELQAKVVDLEKQVAVSQANAQAIIKEPATFWLPELLLAVIVAAALTVWSVQASRLGELRSAFERIAASVSAAIVSLEEAENRDAPSEVQTKLLGFAVRSALVILRRTQSASSDKLQ